LEGDEGVHTEEDGEQSDVLFVGRVDCFGKHLVLSVVDLLLLSHPLLVHQAVDLEYRCHVDLHILSKPAWYYNHSTHD
jgi:hypothetical protein